MPDTARLASALADHYRIERELGAGGMATVYLAHDVRHDRKVALKLLRPELAAVIGADRFLKEIKVTANLQHPHILGLIDSGEVDRLLYYVMPFVEGESLRERLSREKQLPVDDAVRITREVASALDYAHRHHVIHRDIKPENILLHEGQALVADFGIALAVSAAGGTRMTETGMSLGTPHYMSPEQAMGEREITARSDVYALGCVLYEMLVGEPPFTGPTAQSIVAKVLTEVPRPLSPQRHTVPAHVEAAALRALEKLPADRFDSAAQMAEALVRPGYATLPTDQPAVSPAGTARPVPPRWPRVVPWGLAATGCVLAVLGWLRPWVTPTDEIPSRLAMLAPGLSSSGTTALQRQLTLTPDGRSVIYTAVTPAGGFQLVRQDLDAVEPRVIPIRIDAGGTGQHSLTNPVVSWDGRWLVAGTSNGQVLRFPIEGGTGVRIPLPQADYIAFDDKGDLWSDNRSSRVDERFLNHLGARDSLTHALAGRVENERIAQVLPDGHTAIAMLRSPGSASAPSRLLDLETGDTTTLMATLAIEVRYTSGLLIYVLGDGTMMAAPFDPGRRRITGTAVTVATGVSTTGTGIAQIAVSPNGTVAYIPEEPRSLVFVDRSGAVRPVVSERANYHAPMFSPDGRRLSTDLSDIDGRDVRVMNLGEGTLTRATFDRDGHDATWTLDGRFLTYTSFKTGVLGIYRTRPGQAEPAESLLTSQSLAYTGLWLPDGSGLVTAAQGLRPESGLDIGLVTNRGRGPIEPIAASRFSETHPALSPDGRWLAFVSNQSGESEVYVRPLSGDGDLLQVSRGGGAEPVWSRDGRELFYRGTVDGRPELVAASVRTAQSFTVTARHSLFPVTDMVTGTPHTNFDVSPDGRSFVMVRRSPGTRIMIIQNLPALVARLRGAAVESR